MGALLDNIAKNSKPTGCSIGGLLKTLPKDLRTDLKAALDAAHPHAWIARALTDVGYKTSSSTVGRHQNHNCGCD